MIHFHPSSLLDAFAGTAFLQCPLTLDDEAFRQSVSQLDVGIIPQGGTALAEAIETAQSAFKQDADNHRVLVLFTDGEDHDSGALAAAEKAAGEGLRIFTVGVGTANGELLRQRDELGKFDYVKDPDGNVVKSRLNQKLLTEIATAGNGFYLPMTGADTVDVLYQRGLAPLPKSEISTKLIKQFQSRYQWPLLLAVLLLLAELFLPDRRKVQRTDAMTLASNPELRKMVATLLVALCTVQASASPSSALRKYQSGQYKDAYQEYSRLLSKRPDDVRLQYNTGTAAYQAKKFEEAVKHFSAAAATPDLQLQEHAYYNWGNSLYRVGDEESAPEKKSESWEQAARQYEAALKLDPKDTDAKANLDLVRRKLEQLKQEQQKQKEQSKDQKQDDKDKKDDDQNKDQKKDDQKKEDQKQAKDSKDSKDSKPKPDESPSDKNSQAQKQPEPTPEEKEKQKQQQAAKQEKKDAKDDAAAQSADKQKQEGETNATENASTALAGQMTPEQVKQLLDSQKNNEKTMMFIPSEKLKNRSRSIKDW